MSVKEDIQKLGESITKLRFAVAYSIAPTYIKHIIQLGVDEEMRLLKIKVLQCVHGLDGHRMEGCSICSEQRRRGSHLGT